ncbi:MAG: RidA family protein [Acidimicrobiales bacterium]|nr:Rid family hydrolase [Actinomycetota bacterium]MDA8183338.1 Rid family hydrolase [Actinomycetota bacterium]
MSSPIGPYAPAMRAGPWLVCSGQIGVLQGQDGPELAGDGLEEQARQALANVAEVLSGRGFGWTNVVKTTVFLAGIEHYAAFNDVYREVLGDHRPARSVVAVAGLPMGALVEVEAWAYSG